jgi:gamma-glutamylcyclotransferase
MGSKSNAAIRVRLPSAMEPDLYFAYGSNLCADRLRERVPSARVRGAARVLGFELRLDKLGADGTAKANLRAALHGEVWGALYALDRADWPRLDACERGYGRIEIEVILASGARAIAQTYRSDRLTDAAAAPWYTQLIREGAHAHGLPAQWRTFLDGLCAP